MTQYGNFPSSEYNWFEKSRPWPREILSTYSHRGDVTLILIHCREVTVTLMQCMTPESTPKKSNGG